MRHPAPRSRLPHPARPETAPAASQTPALHPPAAAKAAARLRRPSAEPAAGSRAAPPALPRALRAQTPHTHGSVPAGPLHAATAVAPPCCQRAPAAAAAVRTAFVQPWACSAMKSQITEHAALMDPSANKQT
eukprot:354206-Chlamydomonas_euryale.AAC.2